MLTVMSQEELEAALDTALADIQHGVGNVEPAAGVHPAAPLPAPAPSSAAPAPASLSQARAGERLPPR